MIAIESFHATHAKWLSWLAEFELDVLRKQPVSGGWSIGQLYHHLINETNWYFQQASACIGNVDHLEAEKTEAAKEMFANNSFPNIKIEGNLEENSRLPQPDNKELLYLFFNELGPCAQKLWEDCQASEILGKTQHPGLQYFSPEEWIQFSDMHMRHHIKQKNYILNHLS